MKCVECGNNTDGKKWGSPFWCALCEFKEEEENVRDEEEYRGTEEGSSEEGGRLDGEGKE